MIDHRRQWQAGAGVLLGVTAFQFLFQRFEVLTQAFQLGGVSLTFHRSRKLGYAVQQLATALGNRLDSLTVFTVLLVKLLLRTAQQRLNTGKEVLPSSCGGCSSSNSIVDSTEAVKKQA